MEDLTSGLGVTKQDLGPGKGVHGGRRVFTHTHILVV